MHSRRLVELGYHKQFWAEIQKREKHIELEENKNNQD